MSPKVIDALMAIGSLRGNSASAKASIGRGKVRWPQLAAGRVVLAGVVPAWNRLTRMSHAPGGKKSSSVGLPLWLTAGNLAVAGLFVFVIVAAPASIFYARFGVTLADVGASYAGLLTTSLVGLVAYIFVAACVSLLVLLLGVSQAVYINTLSTVFLGAAVAFKGGLFRRRPWEWNDEEFGRYANWIRRVWKVAPGLAAKSPVELVIAQRAGARAAAVRAFGAGRDVDAARKALADRAVDIELNPMWFLSAVNLREYLTGWRRSVLSVASIVLLLGFPAFGAWEAERVSVGIVSPWVQSGVLGFKAQEVLEIQMVDGANLVPNVPLGPERILLGRTSDQIILLDTASGKVIRLTGGSWAIITRQG